MTKEQGEKIIELLERIASDLDGTAEASRDRSAEEAEGKEYEEKHGYLPPLEPPTSIGQQVAILSHNTMVQADTIFNIEKQLAYLAENLTKKHLIFKRKPEAKEGDADD